MHPRLDIQPEVRTALEAGRPVVALESTIISHGMPYPRNVETARRVEETVRRAGATPATLAVLGGRPTIGLSDSQLEHLGKASGVLKVSRRDLPMVMAGRKDGATTVAATMILADLAGIRIFVTGGIGGAHRGAESTFDISADLEELARTDVAVVCAGAKSILDLPKTLEILETRGVPVLGYGTENLPAFFVRDSGLPLDQRVDSPEQIAGILHHKWALGLRGGVVIANPAPKNTAMDPADADQAIQTALAEADEQGLGGKDVTPFLLQRIDELTGGESLQTNIALVLSNAELGARIAVAFASYDQR